MIWDERNTTRRRFALWPTHIGAYWVWLECYTTAKIKSHEEGTLLCKFTLSNGYTATRRRVYGPDPEVYKETWSCD